MLLQKLCFTLWIICLLTLLLWNRAASKWNERNKNLKLKTVIIIFWNKRHTSSISNSTEKVIRIYETSFSLSRSFVESCYFCFEFMECVKEYRVDCVNEMRELINEWMLIIRSSVFLKNVIHPFPIWPIIM